MHGKLAGQIMATNEFGYITRETVELILDFHISLEGNPRNALDNDLEFEDLQARYKEVIEKGYRMLKTYAQVIPPRLEAMQDEYYSFTNSPKYARSIMTAGVARSILRQAWDGINGFRA
jgi:hypothetical protein